MTAPETAAVLTAIASDAAPARFVGGCVRDSVLGRPVKDVDIATPTPPVEIMRLLAEAGLKAIPTGLAHGTVTAISGHRQYEITTLRRDVETDGRRAVVAFTDDWVADAARRDFTVNAMFCDPDGTLYDPFGGAADLAAGCIRFVGEPALRIDEDALRLLRFFRFYAHYGRPPPHAASLAACAAKAPALRSLSGERVREETRSLLAADAAPEVLSLMVRHGVLDHFLPEAVPAAEDGFALLAALIRIERALDRPDPWRRLAAVLRGADADADAADAVAVRLRFSNRDRAWLVAAVAPQDQVTPRLGAAARRRLLHRLGGERFRSLALLGWAAAGGDDGGWRALVEDADRWRPVVLPVRGRDVLALGVPAGDEVGRLLGEVERWWEEGGCVASRSQALDKLRSLVAESGR